jgi:hypothetical protein
MASYNACANNRNYYMFGNQLNMFDNLPSEILMIISKECGPEDLYNLISTYPRFYNLVMPNISQYAHHYANVMPLDIEKFMWNLFDNYNENKEKLFHKMLMVHVFAKSNLMEQLWEVNNMDNNHDFGPLPQDPTQLYIKKFQAGIVSILNNYDLYQSSLFSYDILNNEVLDFLLKFINKYRNLSEFFQEHLICYIEDFLEQNMDFDWIDEYIQEALSYGAKEEDIFNILIDEDYIDEYLVLLSYGIEPERAKDDIYNDDYTEEQLQTYNSIRYIIGNELAHYYILDRQIDINTIPNFLQNIVLILSIGIVDINIINKFLKNPTNVCFENIRFQHEVIGSVNLSLI